MADPTPHQFDALEQRQVGNVTSAADEVVYGTSNEKLERLNDDDLANAVEVFRMLRQWRSDLEIRDRVTSVKDE